MIVDGKVWLVILNFFDEQVLECVNVERVLVVLLVEIELVLYEYQVNEKKKGKVLVDFFILLVFGFGIYGSVECCLVVVMCDFCDRKEQLEFCICFECKIL